jgi:TRAP-type mannitol/chloroaromatic compound transport system permease large subunit
VKKQVWVGLGMMAVIVGLTFFILPSPAEMSSAHLGLLMLSLVVVAIMLGFPTAFTLMGMGTLFTYLAYRYSAPELALQQTLDLMVQRTYGVMTNDVLISVPLFVFMGYLVERANLIERLFRSLHLAMSFVPGSLAVATLATCALFATATGIVGAVVTLMGLLALPSMLRSGYDVKLSAGVITAGGCLGILIPPSVLLILYGATAGVSVVQLYAGALFPGVLLAGLYMGYVILVAKLRPHLAPVPPPEERRVDVPARLRVVAGGERRNALPGLVRAVVQPPEGVSRGYVAGQLAVTLLPALVLAAGFVLVHFALTAPPDTTAAPELTEFSGTAAGLPPEDRAPGVSEPPLEEPPGAEALPAAAEADAGAATGLAEPPGAEAPPVPEAEAAKVVAPQAARSTPRAFWIALAIALLLLAGHYAIFTFERLEILKMLLTSFFPLTTLILMVLGSILFGWATPTEAAALGAAGAMLLTGGYRRFTWRVLKESVYLTAKTSAMVCWLFVGSSIFSAAFALLGGQGLVESWVLGLDLSPLEFMLLAQAIIFLLGWPLEWTEIIVIFIPIFIPLLNHFTIDPLFFGLMVALNLQTAFLSPPVAMAAFYLKGVAPPHVTLNQIFLGMMPFMVIQVVAMFLLYLFPGIGLWLPQILYR